MADQLPEILTKKAFAELNGWRPSYVTKLAQQDRLVMTDDGKRIRVAESLALIEQTRGARDDVADRHAQDRERAADEGGDDLPLPRNDPTLDQARRTKLLAESRTAAAKADQEEMERDRAAGRLLDREEVEFVLDDFGATLRGLLDNLADRLAPVVYPLDTLEDTHRVIAEEAEQLLLEMAESMKRKAEAIGGNAK